MNLLSNSFTLLKVISMNMASGNGAAALINIRGMRAKYKDKHETFLESDLVAKEPIAQFKAWFDEACNTPGIVEANAMCLSTAKKNGAPSARYVLLKGYGQDGFKFYTNYESRKGQDIEENPLVALTFYWEPLKKSVRVEGKAEKLNTTESEEYFRSRPIGSQIGACVSSQSSVIASRHCLVEKERELMSKYAGKEVPCPPHWGGYRVIPEMVEFWQGQSDRLHDRIRFRLAESAGDYSLAQPGANGWIYERLSP